LFPAVGIRSTRGRLAGVNRLHRVHYSRDKGTLSKGISSVAFVTSTYGVMVGHGTISVNAAGAGARINTLSINAGLVIWTVIVQETLWFTLLERISLIVFNARAYSLATAHLTVSVDTTR